MKKSQKIVPFLPEKIDGKYYNYNHKHPSVKEAAEWLLPSIKMYLARLFNGPQRPTEIAGWVTEFNYIERVNNAHISWLGHATELIQIGNFNILTDPIFKDPSRAYKRILPFGASLQQLPPIDMVLLSHNHRDHMDAATLKLLHKKHNPFFLVPEGLKQWFVKRGITKVEEFNWWQSWQQGDLELTFVPAWHWSQRGLFDHNKSLWGGWVIKSSAESIYFAGDTAYDEHYFTTIGKLLGPFDVALLPIGPGEPNHLMRRSHMNAQQAGQAFLDCNAQFFLPMHWGAFPFGIDQFDDPIKRLISWWSDHQSLVVGKSLYPCKVGQQFVLEHQRNVYSNRHVQNR